MALQISEEVSNKNLIDIVVESGRYTKKPIDGLEEILKEAPLKVRGAGVHGKFIFFLLDHEWSIWNTLGMTGGRLSLSRESNLLLTSLTHSAPTYLQKNVLTVCLLVT